jgi:P-type Mg2+ transporter
MDKTKVLTLTQQELLNALQTSTDGLSQQEATKRLAEYGKNQLTKTGHYALLVFVRQLQSSLVYLLVAACVISVWLQNYTDAMLIAIILFINTSLGFFQEYRSERIVEKLSKFISKQVLVKRDGKIFLVDETDIVPGDVVIVREGDIAVADMRLIDVDSLQVNESQLTGESVPITKQVFDKPSDDSARQNLSLVYAGTIIEKGEGIGVVYAAANDTELGVIASLSTDIKKETQYEKSLRSFGTLLIKVTLVGLGLVFVLKILLAHGHLSNVADLFLFIVALSVAVVPEVLPVIATATMTSGAMKLAKQHVVVKRLSSLEDFGNVTMLCTDKTGTITENKMAITKLASEDEQLMMTLAYASIQPITGGKKQFHSSFDEAFITYIPEAIATQAKQFKILKELPFDPDARRRRAVVYNDQSKKHYLVVIGAPEILLEIAKTQKREKYNEEIITESKAGLRHVAIAYKEITYEKVFDILKNEHDLEFLGYATFLDPLWPTAKDTIKQAEKLGIAIKILTGDTREVAEYVGKEVGLIRGGQVVYTGDELEAMPEETFKLTVKNNPVFARVSPRQKYDIINALKADNVVAYQGDGINDAPSLKLADVAIAVENATDIANENADIVLLSDNLGVIIDGIKYGRAIFVNINKYIKYTLVGNWGNFIALGVLYVLATDLPMLPIQVLLTSVVTDLPFISIYADTVEDSEVILPQKHDPKELIMLPLVLGFPTALFSLGAFYLIRNNSPIFIETVLFLFFTMLQMFAFFSVRTTGHFWKGSRPSLILTTLFLAALILSVLIIYIRPFQAWFNFISLPVYGVIAILLLMVMYLFIMDVIKLQYYRASGKARGFSRA